MSSSETEKNEYWLGGGRGPAYWLGRFDVDSKTIDEADKQRLVRALFVDFLGLEAGDIEFFFDPN